MRSLLFALVLAACVSTPPPVAPSPPEPPPAPPPAPMVTALPSMVPPGQSAMPETAPDTPEAAPTAIAAQVAGPRRGGLEHAMANCPTAVQGAVTRAVNTEFGVDLTITADDPVSQRRIVELAARHEQMGDPDGAIPPHTGRHGGPGGIGHCPVFHDSTTVTFTKLRRGAVIHLRALLPSDVTRVQAIVADRLATFAQR
ncbi:MAG TPA: hypothetical protein VF516_41785 [Kofleriaceae bacterium]